MRQSPCYRETASVVGERSLATPPKYGGAMTYAIVRSLNTLSISVFSGKYGVPIHPITRWRVPTTASCIFIRTWIQRIAFKTQDFSSDIYAVLCKYRLL
jgi:hypothetical protein